MAVENEKSLGTSVNAKFKAEKQDLIKEAFENTRSFEELQEKLNQNGVQAKTFVVKKTQNETEKEGLKPRIEHKHRAVSFTDMDNKAIFDGHTIDLPSAKLISKFGEPNEKWYFDKASHDEWNAYVEQNPELKKTEQNITAKHKEENKEVHQLEKAEGILQAVNDAYKKPGIETPANLDEATYYATLEKIDAAYHEDSNLGVYNFWAENRKEDIAQQKALLDKKQSGFAQGFYDKAAIIGFFQKGHAERAIEQGMLKQHISIREMHQSDDRKTMILLASEKASLDRALQDPNLSPEARKLAHQQLALNSLKAQYAKFSGEFRDKESIAVFASQKSALTQNNIQKSMMDLKGEVKRGTIELFYGKKEAHLAEARIKQEIEVNSAKSLKYAMQQIKPKEPIKFNDWLAHQEKTQQVRDAIEAQNAMRYTPQQRIEMKQIEEKRDHSMRANLEQFASVKAPETSVSSDNINEHQSTVETPEMPVQGQQSTPINKDNFVTYQLDSSVTEGVSDRSPTVEINNKDEQREALISSFLNDSTKSEQQISNEKYMKFVKDDFERKPEILPMSGSIVQPNDKPHKEIDHASVPPLSNDQIDEINTTASIQIFGDKPFQMSAEEMNDKIKSDKEAVTSKSDQALSKQIESENTVVIDLSVSQPQNNTGNIERMSVDINTQKQQRSITNIATGQRVDENVKDIAEDRKEKANRIEKERIERLSEKKKEQQQTQKKTRSKSLD